MSTAERRSPIFGPEPWTTVGGVTWCHFDRWFALTTATDFAGDLDELEAHLVGRLRGSLQGRRNLEAKLSHVADLRLRLAAADLDITGLAGAEPADKATVAKARRKVLDQALEGRPMTEAMRDTPAARLDRRARYGAWSVFPVNPDSWYHKLAGRRSPTGVTKGRSFTMTRQLEQRLAGHDGPRRQTADRPALYRAFHTVALELAEFADYSYGNIGELRRDTFGTYLNIDWASTGMAAVDYWQDLCELLVCETYAPTYQEETLPFRRVPAGAADLVETILLRLAEEWRVAYQDYQADEATQLIAWLQIAGRRLPGLPSRRGHTAHRLAPDRRSSLHLLRRRGAPRRLGSLDADRRPAESALAGQHHQLAVDIFRAADQPGMHRDHRRDRCHQLTGVALADRSNLLRVVR